MSKEKYDQSLYQLVSVLTKSEKRYFKLYTQRNSSSSSNFDFLRLFEIIDKNMGINNSGIQKKLSGFNPKKISDLKRNLYAQILDCLRVYHSKKGRFILTSEVDKAYILYGKGLFMESLKILERIKDKAREEQEHLLVFEIIDFEKKIESRHVTRSHNERAKHLQNETEEVRQIIRSEADWSQFSLNLYDKYLQIGHVKNEAEFQSIRDYYSKNHPAFVESNTPWFYSRLYQTQAHQWYYYIIQKFTNCYRQCKIWIELFDEFPEFKQKQPMILIKGLHNILSVLYYCLDEKRHVQYIKKLEDFYEENQVGYSRNTHMQYFVYLHTAKLNQVVLTGKFCQNLEYINYFEGQLTEQEGNIDEHRLLIFWYKLASIYFTMGYINQCVRLLHNILNSSFLQLREDVQCYARLLSLLAHFELGNDEHLGYIIKSTYRFLLKMNEIMIFHQIIIDFLRSSLFRNREELIDSFRQLRDEFLKLENHPFEKRSFLYLDVISWLESKIYNQPVEKIIYRKRIGAVES